MRSETGAGESEERQSVMAVWMGDWIETRVVFRLGRLKESEVFMVEKAWIGVMDSSVFT